MSLEYFTRDFSNELKLPGHSLLKKKRKEEPNNETLLKEYKTVKTY